METNWISSFVTIGLIFLVTLIGAYLRIAVRDRCLKYSDGFHVTVERADGKLVWGVMSLGVDRPGARLPGHDAG